MKQAPQDRARAPRWSWPLSAVAVIALLALAAAYLSLQRDARALHERVQLDAESIQDRVSQRIGEQNAALAALAGLFQASRRVTRAEFERFARGLLARYEHLDQLLFLPRVPRDGVESFEREASASLGSRVRVQPEATDQSSGPGQVYPVLFAAGRGDAPPVTPGRNLAADPELAGALREAVLSGQTSNTLVRYGEGVRYVAALALYRNASLAEGVASRREQASGAILLRASPSGLLMDRAGALPPGRVEVSLPDGRLVVAAGDAGAPVPLLFPEYRLTRDVVNGGQHLQVALTRTMTWGDVDAAGLTVSIAGAVLVGLLLALLNHARRARRSERSMAREALDQERERAQVTLESIADAVATTNAHGRIEYLNPVAEELSGWRQEDATGRPAAAVFRLLGEDSREPVDNPLVACLQEGRAIDLDENLVLVRADGEEFAVHESVAPIADSRGDITGAVMVLRDVSRERRMASEIEFQAKHDSLTALPNRTEFEARLLHAINTARFHERQHAFCYLDLDRFKMVNDSCGHLAGDELLKQLSQLLRTRVRGNDVLARLGGDEFGVLLMNCALPEAERVAETLRHIVGEYRFAWEGRSFEVGVSIGVVPIDATSGTVADVMGAADAACYVAKERGRNRVHVYQPDDADLAQRHGEMQWVHRIYEALEEGRFVLYGQPIVPLADPTGTLAREALLRLVDESGEVLPPTSFIPAAERYGLIESIDRWVVRSALEYLAWGPEESAGPVPALSVNISGSSLADPGFVDFVGEALERTGVRPDRLWFEVTETGAFTNLNAAIGAINRLRELGCGFVLDDFGGAVSAFTHLRTLRVDAVKIDGEFVAAMTSDPVARAMVESIHRIARAMAITTIAEQVEDEATLQALREIGVDFAQGNALEPPTLLVRGRTQLNAPA